MTLPKDCLGAVEENEGGLVSATAAPASAITTTVLSNGWTRRFLRITLNSRDNAVRLITLYAGDSSNTMRTQLGSAISLTNYQTIAFSEDDIRKLIKKFRAASSQNVNLYGVLDACTTGVQVDTVFVDEIL